MNDCDHNFSIYMDEQDIFNKDDLENIGRFVELAPTVKATLQTRWCPECHLIFGMPVGSH